MFEQVNKKLKRRISKAVSIVLCAAMLVTALPAELLGGVASVEAGTSTIVLNANDVAANTTGAAGTDGKFTIGSQMVVQTGQTAKSFTVNDEEKSFTTRIKTGSTTYKNTRSISFVVGEGNTATVTVCAVSGSSSGDAILGLFKGDSTTPTQKKKLTTGDTPTTVFEDVEAGTYYLGSYDVTSGITISGSIQSVNFYYVEVTESASEESNPSVPKPYDPKDLGTTDGVDTATAGDATWTFPVKDEDRDTVGFNGTSGTYRGLKIDASNGKFAFEAGKQHVHLNTGTIIEVPVSGKCDITVTASAGSQYALYTINGTGASTEKIDTTVRYEGEAGYVKIIATGDNAYIKSIAVKHVDESASVEKEVEISVTDELNLVGINDKLVLVNTTDETDIHEVSDGAKAELMTKTTYKAVVQDGDGKAKDGVAATIGGQNTVTVSADTEKITITVVSTVVSVTPAITGDLEGNKLYAVKGNDAIELVNGKAVTLPKNTEYSLVVKTDDGTVLEDWIATAGDSDKFNTGTAETLTLNVTVEHVTEVVITPTIKGKGMLGDNKLYLTADDESVPVDFSGMTLKPNTEYTLEIKADDAEAAVTTLVATVDAKNTYKTGNKDAEIEIIVTVPSTRVKDYSFKSYTPNTKVDAGTVLEGTADVAGIGIIYHGSIPVVDSEKGGNAGTSTFKHDNGFLKFNKGAILYLPIQDTTTSVYYIQTCNGSNDKRLTYVGGLGSDYTVTMSTGETMVYVPDITDFIVTQEGKKYLPILSASDVKLETIQLIEYNTVNTVQVTGTVENAADNNITEIYFQKMVDGKADGDPIPGTIDAEGKYSVTLRRVFGETNYIATIAAPGYKIDEKDDANQFVLLGNDPTAVQNFKVADAPMAKVSGTITGVRKDLLKGDLGVRLIPENPALKPIPLTLTPTENGYSFTAVDLEMGKSYGVELTKADDDEVRARVEVGEEEEQTVEIKASAKQVYIVAGNFLTTGKKIAENAGVKTITFTNKDTPEYFYTFDVTTGTSYTASLREAEYDTIVTYEEGKEGYYEAFDHVSVKAENVKEGKIANDVYLKVPEDENPVKEAYRSTIEVGVGKEFEKISDAVKYIETRMNRTDDQRVTIVLDAGKTYMEQVVINTPNITIKGNGAKVTWYYATEFSEYYSAMLSSDGKSLYYDEAYAVDKYEKHSLGQSVGHWGATVNLLAGAKGFAAEDLTFENSFNYYVTDEELEDGAERTKGMDVFASGAKRKACVLYIQADDTTYKNCNFLSEQDTIYTGDASENSYFVTCKIEGNTDYIAGSGNAVFDRCILSMYCYSDKEATGSFIAANQGRGSKGYLFSECQVVTGTNEGNKGTSENYLVRAWGVGDSAVYFMKTAVETANMICAAGYKDMNATVEEATYYEYYTHTSFDGKDVIPDYEVYEIEEDGKKKVITPGRVKSKGGIMTEDEAKAVRMSTFFDGWMPLYYVGTVDVDSVTVDVLAPRAGATVKTDTTTATPGVTNLSAITWYEGDATEAYTGERYKANTTYRAEMTVDAADGYVFFSEAKAVVTGAASVAVTLSEDKKTLKIKATYTTGDEEKLTTTFTLPIGMSGLKKGRYKGGFTVMDDFATYGSAGFTNVTGDKDHQTGKLSEMSLDPTKAVDIAGEKYGVWVQGLNNPLGENGKGAAGDEADGKLPIPVSGSALILDALADGVVTLVCHNSGKYVSFIDATDPSNITADAALGLTKSSLWEEKVYTIQVKKGHKYYFYAQGSKLKLCAASVEYDGEDVVDNGPVAPGTEDGNDKPGGTEDGTDDGKDTSFDGDDWKKVAKPVIVKAEYTSGDGADQTSSDGKDKGGKLTLTVKADISSKGGTSLDVTVQKVGETASHTETSTAKQDTHVLAFAVSGPGKYKVTAALKRKGMEDRTTIAFVTVNQDGSTSISVVKDREGLYVQLLDEDTEYVYTGSAIKPAIAVWNGDEKLTEGVDYTVKYSNNVKAADKNSGKKAPTITITGKGKYTGKTTQTFTIKKKDLGEYLGDPEDGVVIGGWTAGPQDGTLIVAENTKISPILVYKGVVLKAGAKKDFVLETNITKPALSDTGATITIKGAENNFTGTLTLTLDVKNKKDLKKISSVKIDKKAAGYDYNGEKKEAPISEVKAGKDLVAKENYVVVYNGNRTSAGTQKFTVVGLGIYTGSKTSSFKINPRKNAPLKVTNDLADASGNVSCTFNSAGVTFNDALTVTDNDLGDLVLGKDYKVSYSGNKKVGTGKYTVTFLGNYKGNKAIKNSFNITQADFADLDVSAVAANKAYKKPNQYKSAPFVLVDGVALKKSDYTVKYYFGESEMSKNNKVTLADGETSATVRVVVEGKKNYKGTVETTFEVQSTTGKTDISKAKIKIKDNKKEYTGEAVYPNSIEIKVGKNSPVTLNYNADTDSWTGGDNFDVLVVNNIAKGKATVIVNGAGDNVGSKTATFNVVSRNLTKLSTDEKDNFWDDFRNLDSVLIWPGLQSVQ